MKGACAGFFECSGYSQRRQGQSYREELLVQRQTLKREYVGKMTVEAKGSQGEAAFPVSASAQLQVGPMAAHARNFRSRQVLRHVKHKIRALHPRMIFLETVNKSQFGSQSSR